ncbi:hypothetical protein [Alkalicoccus luteus]|uniref:Uncharacterized protein n=1 Tax=Alkalicoccus luteus TaxID=1237094 RepID=A0A969PLS6_9BACI|nr:hypothetical protein [Alkalicoccus luteus]NJP36537.1 hypothetical protein [Alkalicoccus luteus]
MIHDGTSCFSSTTLSRFMLLMHSSSSSGIENAGGRKIKRPGMNPGRFLSTAVACTIVHNQTAAILRFFIRKLQRACMLMHHFFKCNLNAVYFFNNIVFCRRIQRQSKLRASSAHA